MTGGTCGGARVVEYDARRYRESVEVTRQLLCAHGIGEAARVAVCQPFDPWSIGGIFREAALRCGGQVLPLGLNANLPALWETMIAFRPTAVCCSAGMLRQWLLDRSPPLVLPDVGGPIFHAGELLLPAVRAFVEEKTRGRVVDVYGMAEFDTIGGEEVCGGGLVLSPHLEYAVSPRANGAPQALRAAMQGELFIRARASAEWKSTRDKVRVLGRTDPAGKLWPGSWRVEHQGRIDGTLVLPDGSMIREEQVAAASAKLPRVAYLQLELGMEEAGSKPQLLVRVEPSPGLELPALTEVQSVLTAHCFELADSISHGVVELRCVLTANGKITKTPRGKMLRFIDARQSGKVETAHA